MSESQQTPPWDRVAELLAELDLLAIGAQGLDAGRRVVEGAISTAENFARTMDNLNQTTTRVNALLDEIEEPLRRLLAQAGPALSALASVAESTNALAELAKRLNPLSFVAPRPPSGPGPS